jgi:hypothetical protein
MNDVDYERVVDTRVQRRLAVDAAYRNAEDAEAQAEREAEITAGVERDLEAEREAMRAVSAGAWSEA